MKVLFTILPLLLFATVLYAQADTIVPKVGQTEAPRVLIDLVDKIKKAQFDDSGSDTILEIDGLIFDETKTKNGRDFYDRFFRKWEPPENARNYSIFIKEKPFRVTTTQIEIRINETLVFQSFLQLKSEFIEVLSEQAVIQTKLYLQNYEDILQQIEGEDLSGSGIY
jgi:curli production assembly/transport component CsgE